MVKKYSIRDVAKALHLSICTVSKALSDADYPIAPETRKMILEEVAKLGYVPNINAKRLFSGRTGKIGLVVPDYSSSGIHCFSDKHLTQIISGLEQELEKNQLRLLIIFNNEKFIRNQEFLRLFREREVDALLIWGVCSGDWSQLAEEKFPHLFITTYPESSSPLNRFYHDYASGACQVMRRLLEKGKRRILWCRRVGQDSLTALIREGICKALTDASLRWEDIITETDCEYTEKSALELWLRLLQGEFTCDAILAVSGKTAGVLCRLLPTSENPFLRHLTLACCDTLCGSTHYAFCRVGVDDLLFGQKVMENLLGQIADFDSRVAPPPLPVRFFPGE